MRRLDCAEADCGGVLQPLRVWHGNKIFTVTTFQAILNCNTSQLIRKCRTRKNRVNILPTHNKPTRLRQLTVVAQRHLKANVFNKVIERLNCFQFLTHHQPPTSTPMATNSKRLLQILYALYKMFFLLSIYTFISVHRDGSERLSTNKRRTIKQLHFS